MGERKAGEVRMIDVGEKQESDRIGEASGYINMKADTLQRVLEGKVPKGDILGAARLAAIVAAKKTWELLPLCHPVRLTSVDVNLLPDEKLPGIRVVATARARDRTGVEMEALTAVSVGLLTVYDMLKGIDKSMEISEIHLDRKEGGRSGRYIRGDND
jgi:cyclic pyranopterin phosphate synthase